MTAAEKVLVAAFGLGVALLLAAVFTVSLTLLTIGSVLVLGVFAAGPLLELHRHDERGGHW